MRRLQPNDFWQSVTGSLQPDETPLQAARRELREETGLSDRGLKDCHHSHRFEIYPLWRHRYAPGVTKNREHVFRLCLDSAVSVTLDRKEHEIFIWLSRQEALRRVSSYTNREAIERWVPELAAVANRRESIRDA
jgi:dATP pyrophosphohydrolase